MASPPQVADRERTAHRLLTGSLRRSYEPAVDIDWDAPLDPDKFFLPPKLLSLYGTPLWDEMTHAERVELSRQETANILSVGIWFENILNQLLLRMAYDRDATSWHVQYAHREIADECRHTIMFGRLIDKMEARPYRQDAFWHNFGRLFPLLLDGPAMWVATLMGEEIFDVLQRDTMRDEDLQPIVRQVMRIHVTEEARHIRYAREDLVRRMSRANRLQKEMARYVAAQAGWLLANASTNPEMYARAAL
ncbi:MAG: AurF N-oxygenase family protein, partial [Dehalococcoidia bacterium]